MSTTPQVLFLIAICCIGNETTYLWMFSRNILNNIKFLLYFDLPSYD